MPSRGHQSRNRPGPPYRAYRRPYPDPSKTNWARFNYPYFGYLRAVQEGGYTQDYSKGNGTYWWSKMIYSPIKCVKAVVYSGGEVDTACV
jgi:hypothetical protein